MKIKFIDDDSLLALKSSVSALKENYFRQDNSWIKEYLGYSPFRDTKFDVEDFELDMSADTPSETEWPNVKKVYGSLQFLSESQASEERLWAGLCLGPFWKYTQYRWNIKKGSSANNIVDHFFFGSGSRRSLTRNAMSRLWWIGRLTYDIERNDPYELTKFLCEHADFVFHVLERNTSNNPMIIKTFLTALIDARNDGIKINTNTVGELSKYLNMLGGIYILDCLPEQYIYDKVLEKVNCSA